MRKFKLSISFFACFLSLANGALFAQEGSIRVYEVLGEAKALYPGTLEWAPIAKHDILKKGVRIRVAWDSSIHLALDAKLEADVKIGENSVVELDGARPLKLRVEKGKLWIIQESDPVLYGPAASIEVKTREALLRFDRASCFIQSRDGRTLVKVFSDGVTAEFSGKEEVVVEEGFKTDGAADRRMTYKDYDDWQGWVKEHYRQKDELALHVASREMAELAKSAKIKAKA